MRVVLSRKSLSEYRDFRLSGKFYLSIRSFIIVKLLLLHSDYLEYELKEKTKFAEKADVKKERLEECLAAFVTVEKKDELNAQEVVVRAAEEIENIANTVKTRAIFVYPYAHLSSLLAAPDTAAEIVKNLASLLAERNFTVSKAPFGWYKAFRISCKGHALSEFSREITAEPEKIKREEVLKGIESEYYILTPKGEEIKVNLDRVDDLDVLKSNTSLRKYIYSEEIEPPAKEPPSIEAMRRLELIDYEDASDSGHFRFYPKGHLIFSLLNQWAEYIATEKLHAMQISTPLLYDWSQPDIREQTKSFHQRHYVIETEDRNFVLRFAGDFGLFRMLKTATISYKSLPFRVYEFSKSFRYEQRGELCGLRRLRAFHMPDVHSFTKDVEQGWEEFKDLYCNYTDLVNGVGIEYVAVFRIVKDYYDEWRDKIISLIKYTNQPAFVEVLSGKKHYWILKQEFQAIDSIGGNAQLCTIQLDLEDAERYGILYTDKSGKKKGVTICHSSIGSIERWLYAVLEDALKKGKPELPLWLAPTQIRFIPVTDEFIKDCEKIASELNARVDIDDRDEKVAKKIRDAEREWLSFIIVYGEKERKTGKLSARLRSSEIKEFSLQELKAEVAKQLRNYPYQPLSLPKMLSKRIVFRG